MQNASRMSKFHGVWEFLTNRCDSQMKATMALVEEQHQLLRSVAGSGLETAANVTAQWDQFELMLDSHQLMIKEQVNFVFFFQKSQVDVLKSNVDQRVRNLNDEAEKLFARWNQFKPKNDALDGDREGVIKVIF